MFSKKLFFVLTSILFFIACQPELIRKGQKYDYSGMDYETKELHKKVEDFVFLVQSSGYPIKIHPVTRIKKLSLNKEKKEIIIEFSKPFSYIPFREDNVLQTYSELRKTLGDDYNNYSQKIITLNQPIENLIPNYYRPNRDGWDNSRLAIKSENKPKPIVRKVNKNNYSSHGLYGNNIALWHSHGWYYDQYRDRWLWQRARLFGTVEDLSPMSFTIPYLVPMLENAGANVFLPRERDTQINEIIVDNDSLHQDENRTSYSENRSGNLKAWFSGNESGYAIGQQPYHVNFNPFSSGTYRFTESDTMATAHINWTPSFPDEGHYAVYISYNSSIENVDDALYTVHHTGGKTEFLVNQQIGGGTWIYLGTFKFGKGYHPQNGRVTLSNKSRHLGKIVSADAVKFGGGLGKVLRGDRTSGRPKFTEAARYWLQTAGFPDTLVYSLNDNKSDYKDDYQSRGEWVNYLVGAPAGPNKNRNVPGLGIPIDLSLAFHTDAGITKTDTTFGTLQIYSLTGADTQTVFPSGISRMANRDLSDLVQSQLVDDIKKLFDAEWTRRFLMDAQYSEAYRPNVPSTLLELLSHQNFFDMKFALDPRFRFHASRAIYKAMLRFIATQNKRDYIVQPLPVDHFSAVFDNSGNIILNWQPKADPLEPTANANSYKVYTRINKGGFNNGQIVEQNQFKLNNPIAGQIYSFKVTALNDGGESFPSEILAVCKMDDNRRPILIVNGFDRVAPPATIDQGDWQGFAYNLDNGVPDKYDISFIGDQHNFDKNSKWVSDDRTGHGASYADQETKVIAGNTFDYPFIHGDAIKTAGFSFVSASDEAVMDEQIKLQNYNIVDLIMGEEKETGWQRTELDSIRGTEFKTFPEKLKRQVRTFLSSGGSLFLSGAYIGTDLFHGKETYPDKLFAREVLKMRWVANHAVKNGDVFTVKKSAFQFPENFTFNTKYNTNIYRVEAPDAIRGFGGSKTIIRYKENGFSAGIAFSGKYKIVTFGFPFETISEKENRVQIMKTVIDFFEAKIPK
ncbi:MAG: xanthan lyase [Calditrichaeota bacterium]|nr:MAG: xanthan lyase [Calditrichota bacterium]MBL1207752.1 xanthan lyase [Calditrichota bacterium]NOG47586.1 xanthan lyase [Calditrichota bacterium]